MSNSLAIEIDTQVKPRAHKISLSVYRYPYSWKTWSGFWGNIKQWFVNRSFAKQRAKQGYSRAVIWECGDFIIDHTLAMLIEYRNNTNSFPISAEFPTFESWIAFIDEIIDLFEYARKDSDEINQYYKSWLSLINNVNKCDWTEEQKELNRLYRQEVRALSDKQVAAQVKAFTMLAPHLKKIWW